MKKIAVLWTIFCIISPQIFPDENHGKLDKYYFPWQLYNYYSGNNIKNTSLKYSFENNDININLQVDTRDISFLDYLYLNNGKLSYTLGAYLYIPFIKEADTKDISFYDHIYLNSGKLGYTLGSYFYAQYQIFSFLNNFFGGPERRRMENFESNRRYNILNPAEPPKKDFLIIAENILNIQIMAKRQLPPKCYSSNFTSRSMPRRAITLQG
jgi:hypothetical protein